jgi:hypothetical protein
MDCPNCKTVNEDSYRFCRECGRALSQAINGTSIALAPVAAAPVRKTGIAGTQLAIALGAVAAGAVIVILCAIGFRSARTHRSKLVTARPARAFIPTPIGPMTQWPPAPPPVQATVPSSVASSAHGFVVPPAPQPQPVKETALAPATVRSAEPMAPGEASPGEESSDAGSGESPGATPAPGTVSAGVPGGVGAAPPPPSPGSPSIRIQLLDGNGKVAPPAPPRQPERPRLDIEVAPVHTQESALQEGLDHQRAAEHAETGGQLSVARGEYLEAARIFRLVAQRGGRDATAARQRLAVCERALGMAR